MNEIYPYFCMLLKCLYEAINKTLCEKIYHNLVMQKQSTPRFFLKVYICAMELTLGQPNQKHLQSWISW